MPGFTQGPPAPPPTWARAHSQPQPQRPGSWALGPTVVRHPVCDAGTLRTPGGCWALSPEEPPTLPRETPKLLILLRGVPWVRMGPRLRQRMTAWEGPWSHLGAAPWSPRRVMSPADTTPVPTRGVPRPRADSGAMTGLPPPLPVAERRVYMALARGHVGSVYAGTCPRKSGSVRQASPTAGRERSRAVSAPTFPRRVPPPRRDLLSRTRRRPSWQRWAGPWHCDATKRRGYGLGPAD